MVVNTRNGKAYAAFPELGIVKIVTGAAGPVVTLKTGANVKSLTLDPRSGRVYAMNRGPGTISVIDPDAGAVFDTTESASRRVSHCDGPGTGVAIATARTVGRSGRLSPSIPDPSGNRRPKHDPSA